MRRIVDIDDIKIQVLNLLCRLLLTVCEYVNAGNKLKVMCSMDTSKESSDKCESKKDSDNICRLCMSMNANVPIFPDNNELKNCKGPPLVCKIKSSINIQVKKDDGLPTRICNDCVSKVESTYEFLRLCEMSDSFLRQYLDFGLHISWILRYSELFSMIDHREEEQDNEL